jgi:hypothetical protein
MLSEDLATFMKCLKPYQTKGHGIRSANTYWVKHVFEDTFGHYMIELSFVEALLALSDGWLIKKTTRPTRDSNPALLPWCLNIKSRDVEKMRKTYGR